MILCPLGMVITSFLKCKSETAVPNETTVPSSVEKYQISTNAAEIPQNCTVLFFTQAFIFLISLSFAFLGFESKTDVYTL